MCEFLFLTPIINLPVTPLSGPCASPALPAPSTIKLAYKNLGDAGACRLAELLRGPLKNVTILDLSCTSIGSAGTAALAVVCKHRVSRDDECAGGL